jgi:glycosyltransferase involved in cell wall biosynthesis
VTVLPSAIDPDAWRGLAPSPEHGRLRLVTTARLHPRKRVEALVRIVAEVRRRVGPAVNVTLEVMGGGERRTALGQLVRRLGLEDSVLFHGEGTDDDVRSLLSRGDVFVNACDRESFGIATLEASCAGLPVVGRSEGGMVSFVDQDRNGILVGSDEAMVRALLDLATEPSRLGRLRTGAGEGIPASYGWERVVDLHLALYREVLDVGARFPLGVGGDV